MKTPYSYIVLRYVHDVATEEFVNVGVAIYAPSKNFLKIRCRSTYGRLSKTFPGMHGDYFRKLMRHFEASFTRLGSQMSEQLSLSPKSTKISDYAKSVLPLDDSSLQWSAPGSGIALDLESELDELFERMVMLYDAKTARPRIQDDDVWRGFRTPLANRDLIDRLNPKTIAVADDKVEFDYAWKNGIYHCLEPLSFDLSSADSIRDKAHQWLGRVSSIQSSQEAFRIYFLVGAPQENQLLNAYNNALSILQKSPIQTDVVRQEEADRLPALLMERSTPH